MTLKYFNLKFITINNLKQESPHFYYRKKMRTLNVL